MGIKGIKHLINWHDEWVEATPSDILAKGNNEEYPTFTLEDGSVVAVHISNVKDIPDEEEIVDADVS